MNRESPTTGLGYTFPHVPRVRWILIDLLLAGLFITAFGAGSTVALFFLFFGEW